MKCNKREILEKLVVMIASYAPHIGEELWSLLGHKESVTYAAFPVFEEKYVKENSCVYPVSFNGKMRFKLELPVDMSKDDVIKAVMAEERAQKWIDDKTPKKIIVVPKKIINIVL